MVSENDDARGVLQFSNSTYNAEEPSQNFVIVNREAGTFGMVSVFFISRVNTPKHTLL